MQAPDTPAFDLTPEFSKELADAPADERVCRIALQLSKSTRVPRVAERADCAPDTARGCSERLVPHLDPVLKGVLGTDTPRHE